MYGELSYLPYADAGWASSTGASAATYGSTVAYWVGPGNWVYSVDGATGPVTVLWSPTSKREINKVLDAATAGKVRAELVRQGRKFATKIEAFAVVGASTSTSTTLSAYLPSLPSIPGYAPETTAASTTKITEQPWFWPVVVAGGGIALLFLLRSAPKKAAPAPVKHSTFVT
jgi:hypothetical protein